MMTVAARHRYQLAPKVPPRLLIALANLITLVAVAGFPALTRAQPTQTGAFVAQERYEAAEAHQAVAVGERYFYAIDDYAIGKYDKETGMRVGGWEGNEEGTIQHLNGCIVRGERLYCAHSDYPAVPMTSSIEIWNTRTMEHAGSHAFGIYEGAANWIDEKDGDWWVAFANYGRGKNGSGPSGGVPGRGAAWTTIVRFGPEWQRREAWTLPQAVIDQMAPYSTSGGAWRPGTDRLYVTGHDASELYVLERPDAGAVLRFVETVPFPGEGQGIAWDPVRCEVLYGLRRDVLEVVVARQARGASE